VTLYLKNTCHKLIQSDLRLLNENDRLMFTKQITGKTKTIDEMTFGNLVEK
jgi:hypothetical protein